MVGPATLEGMDVGRHDPLRPDVYDDAIGLVGIGGGVVLFFEAPSGCRQGLEQWPHVVVTGGVAPSRAPEVFHSALVGHGSS